MKINLLLILILVFISCSGTNETKQNPALNGLNSYFEEEIKILEKSEYKLIKTLVQEGKTERIEIENPDWKTEMIPFTETLSGPSAIRQSFSRDTVKSGSSLAVTLKSKDASSVLSSVLIYTNSGQYDSIIIIKQVANTYYSSTDTLKYFTKGNYTIKAENLPGAGKKIGFTLEGRTAEKDKQ